MLSSREEALSALERLVPNFKFLGASFWVAWQLVLYGCEVTFCGVSLDSSDVAAVYVAVSLSFSAVLVLTGAFHRQAFALIGRPPFVVAMGLLGSVGTVLVFVLQPLGGWWHLAGAVLAGAGTAFVACRSILQFAELGPREVIFMTALVQVAAFGIDYTVLSIADAVQPWLFFSLPLIASAFLLVEPDEDCLSVPDDGWEAPRWFWRFVVGVLFLAIPVSICRVCFPLYSEAPGMLIDHRRMSGVLIIAAMLVLAIVSLRLSRRAKYGLMVYCLMLAVSGIYVLMCAFGPQSGTVLELSGAVNALLNLCVWVLLARIAFSSGASTLRVFGFGYGSFMAGGVAGWGVGLAAEAFSWPLDTVVAVLVASAIVVLLVVLFLFRPRDLGLMMLPIHEPDDEAAEGGTAGRAPEKREEASSGEVLSEEAPSEGTGGDPRARGYSAWRHACLLLGEDCRLSLREMDVLDLMARGFSARAVSEELCISYNTARNHIQRIYAKCGVHSKDELHALIRDLEAKG